MNGNLPPDMLEGDIEFAPTYKLIPNKDKYDSKRISGWTDRILYKGLTQKSYDSINKIKISDHRPVFSQFELQIIREESHL